MASTTTLRVRLHTRDRLNRLARSANVSASELLEQLVTREEERRMLDGMNDDFQRLRADDARWSEYKAETDAWDTTGADAGATD